MDEFRTALEGEALRQVDGAEPGTASKSVGDDSVGITKREALEDLLERLPKAEAEVIDLAIFGGMTHLEIAEHLGLSEERVNGRMRLGMKKLVRSLEAKR